MVDIALFRAYDYSVSTNVLAGVVVAFEAILGVTVNAAENVVNVNGVCANIVVTLFASCFHSISTDWITDRLTFERLGAFPVGLHLANRRAAVAIAWRSVRIIMGVIIALFRAYDFSISAERCALSSCLKFVGSAWVLGNISAVEVRIDQAMFAAQHGIGIRQTSVVAFFISLDYSVSASFCAH